MQKQSNVNLFSTQLSRPVPHPWSFAMAFFLQTVAAFAWFFVPPDPPKIPRPHYDYLKLTAPPRWQPVRSHTRPSVNSLNGPDPLAVIPIRDVGHAQARVAPAPIPPPVLAVAAPLLAIPVPHPAVLLSPQIHVNVLENLSTQPALTTHLATVKTGLFESADTAGTAGQRIAPEAAVIQQTGFNLVPGTSTHHRPSETVSTTPVAIQSKPAPVYTDEARQLHIEGEVLLDVVFTAGGNVRVLQVVQGLGHGLDEAAIHAAEQIRFSPAEKAGQPVDCPATLHVVFSLS
jgi:TonB family protein